MAGMSSHDILTGQLFETSKAILGVDRMDVMSVVGVLKEARDRKSFVWLIGNGGSAATVSHFANDLEKVCGIRAVPLPELTSTITAYGNDNGWSRMFADALDGYAGPEDVLVIFSCSGFSENVIEAAFRWWAKTRTLLIFTGNNRDSKLLQSASAEAVIFVEHPDIMVQETVHLALCHAIVHILKEI